MRMGPYPAFDGIRRGGRQSATFFIVSSAPDRESLLVDARERETLLRVDAEWAKALLDGKATLSRGGNKLYPKLAYKVKSVEKATDLLYEGPAYTRYFVLPIVREKTGGGRIILSTIAKRLRSIGPPILGERRDDPLSEVNYAESIRMAECYSGNRPTIKRGEKIERGHRRLVRYRGESEWLRAIEIRSRNRIRRKRSISSDLVYACEGKHEGSMLFATRKYRLHGWERVEEDFIACGPTESVSAFMSDIRSILAEAESPWDSFIREWLEAFTLSAAPIVDGLVDRPDPVGVWSLGLWWEPIYRADREREREKEAE
jgi:hypothetical protein